jgi:predicted ATPase
MKAKPTETLRFSHIYLENWRNFVRVDTNLQRRVFLVGPNASGKSNFLDVFRFLHDIVSFGGGFQEAVAKRGGVSKLRCLAARRRTDITIHVKILEISGDLAWEYKIRFTQDNLRRPLIREERVIKNGEQIMSRPNQEDRQDTEQLRQTYLEQVRANKDFRALANFFESIDYLHMVPQLVRDPDRYRGQQNDPFGWDFLEEVRRKPKRTREAWLRRIGDALRVAVPQLQELELWPDDRGLPHLRGKYEHWRDKGAWQTEEQFSDGTLRLVGLLWSTLDGTGPLLLEEPEMSLHPDVVRFIPQLLARAQRRTGRQVLLSSHSSDLLRDEGIGLDEVLVLQPGTEGTEVKQADRFAEIKILLKSGSSLAEVVLPRTRPKDAHQLSLFGD